MSYRENMRVRRPYEKKRISKSGALLFGIGLGALLATVAVVMGLLLPSLAPHLDNTSYRFRSYYRQLMPHDEYLPAPAIAAEIKEAAPLPQALPQVSAPQPLPAATSTGDTVVTQPVVAPADLPPAAETVQLEGLAHQWQTWNNCGPATVTMAMSYFGRTETQVDAAAFLKPNRDDKNVSPFELAAYARTTGMEALVRQGGSIEQVKLFLSHNLPVLAETWLVHDGDGLGHYRLMTGFDDTTGEFNTFDSLNGPNYKVSYEQFDADWRVFNRLYIVIFPAEQADLVRTVIGPDIADAVMYERILAEAQAEITANPQDAVAYFNQGEALTRLGRSQEAAAAFDQARTLGLHWRRLWYQFTPFEAYYAVGRYGDVLELAEATLEGTGGLEEAYYYRGLARHATGLSGAEEDFEAALAYNPNFVPAIEAQQALEVAR